MTKRRRYYRNGNGNGHGFNWATIGQSIWIPLFTGLIVLSGFYYVTKDKLADHDRAINTVIPEEFKEEAAAREKTRNEFLDKFDKLNSGIGTLNTNVAVQTKALEQLQAAISARR